MVASTPESNRNNQGEILPEVPPFIAPPEGQTPDSINLDFGVVQRTATGPSNDGDIETLFANTFSLSKGNTALPGGTFFVEERGLVTFDETNGGDVYPQILGLTSASGEQSGRLDHRVINEWLFYARGFTQGGYTGVTFGENILQGVTVEYSDSVGNVLSDLYVNTMDLPTIPAGDYSGFTGIDANTRTNNKVIYAYGTGETFSANFRAANTDMLFSVNYINDSLGANTENVALTVQTIHTGTEDTQQAGGFNAHNVVGSSYSIWEITRLNRGQQNVSKEDLYVLNPMSDLVFNMTSSTRGIASGASESIRPKGNVLKCNFPVPVRGFCILSSDKTSQEPGANFNSSTFTEFQRGSRLFVEGDFVDGSTFTYILFGRRGPVADAGNNSSSVGSYLALNSRTDKHIKNLYISNVHDDVILSGGYLDHGPVNIYGPSRYYCDGQSGFKGDYEILQGLGDSFGTGPGHTDQDDVMFKLSVMPRYEHNHFQLEKRPAGGARGYGDEWTDLSEGGVNRASYNEWRKISKNQVGKTFGRTGGFWSAFGSFLSVGHGVTFSSAAVTGSILGITMGFTKGGDQVSTLEPMDEPVEAFQYEVIKGTTVDGTFIPVWKKTRTL